MELDETTTNDTNSTALLIIPACIAMITMAMSFIFFKLTWNFYYKGMAITIDGYHQLFNNICYAFTILTAMADCIHLIVSIGSNRYDVIQISPPINYIMLVSDIFFFIQSIVLYFILFIRVYLPFKDSIYAISCWSLLVVISLMFITLCSMCIYGYYLVSPQHSKLPSNLRDLQTMIYIMMICDFTINVILLYLLISKLKQVFNEMKFQDNEYANKSTTNENIKDDYESYKNDKKFNDDDWSKISMLSSNKLKDIITSRDNPGYSITPYDPRTLTNDIHDMAISFSKNNIDDTDQKKSGKTYIFTIKMFLNILDHIKI